MHICLHPPHLTALDSETKTCESFAVLIAEACGSVGELRTQGLGVQPGGARRAFLTGV